MDRKKGMKGSGFRQLLKPYRWRILFLAFLTVMQSLLQVAMAVITRNVIDAALGGSEKLLFWGAVLATDVIAIVLCHAMVAWFTGSTADKMSQRLRLRVLRTALFSREESLLDRHSGELLSRGIEDVHTVCDGSVHVIPTLLGQGVRLVATFCAVLLIQPAVAVTLLVVAALVGAAAALLRPQIKKRHRLVRQTDEKVMATMQEDLQQLELIQSLEVQGQVLRKFRKRLQESLSARRRQRVWSVGSNGLINAASQMGTGALLLWGAGQIAAGQLSYGSLTAMLQLLSLFRAPVVGMSGLWSRLASMEVSAERLHSLLLPEEKAAAPKQKLQVQSVVFENVTFAYPGEETPVLESFNARFDLSNWVCLTGFSGKGKTTMFKLMLGLYNPQSGSVYLETDQGNIPCSESTRYLFAYVPQDYALLSGTIRENLTLVAPEVTQEQLKQALTVAQAEFVWELSNLDMAQVKENNAGLSKGQFQRLAIARAILMDRAVFLLDECTSALDSQTEDAVLQGLKALGKPAILVTHRPEAVKSLGDINGISLEA